ncbi:MAG: hypothetical protein FWD57_17225 [Polyangiaceae bacterium]|nr:hypothetical protein [Polyangiaceae bacterium]
MGYGVRVLERAAILTAAASGMLAMTCDDDGGTATMKDARTKCEDLLDKVCRVSVACNEFPSVSSCRANASPQIDCKEVVDV